VKNRTVLGIFFFLLLMSSNVFGSMVENSRQGLPAISAELRPAQTHGNTESHQGLSLVLLEIMADSLIGFEGGNNLFVYANNNPLLYIDPYGQSPSLILALLAELGFMTEFEKTAAEQAWSQAQIQYQLTQVIKDIKKREGENPCDPKLDPLKNVKAGLEDLLSQSKKPGNFDPSLHEDQQDDDWYFHWDKAPHDKRGGGPHWDRGNKKTGRQEWSPDGINWYKK